MFAPSLSYYQGTYSSPAQLARLSALAGAPTAAGSYTVLAAFPGSADYDAAEVAGELPHRPGDAEPHLESAGRDRLRHGAGATQLDAAAGVGGRLTYTPAIGAVLGAGARRSP